MVPLEGAVLQVEVLQLETITRTEILQVLQVHQEVDHPVLQGADHPALQGVDHPVLQGADHPVLQGVDHPVLQGADHPVLQGVDHPVLQEVVLQREALQFQLQLDYQREKETK